MDFVVHFTVHREALAPLYDLLLLADPEKHMIEQYIHQSDIVTVHTNGQLIGLYVLFPINDYSAEIKNMAVTPAFQGKGIGQSILDHTFTYAHQKGIRKLIIGTGNSSIGQLYLYQKAGFRITEIKPDFFTTHYPTPIFENGIACRDMIVLTKMLG